MSDLTPAEKASVIRQVEGIPKRKRPRVMFSTPNGATLDEVVEAYRFIRDLEQDRMRRARADLERKFLDWER